MTTPTRTWREKLLTEQERPASIKARSNAPWLAVITVCFGAFMGQLDASIVTIAFPAMRAQFHTGLGAIEWVSLSYLVTLVAMLTPVGRFSDVHGRKLLYTWGFGVFTVASAVCGAAPTLAALLVFRVIQAFGAALMQSNSVALVTTSVRPADLRKALGIQGTAQALGLALGPTVGGLLVAAGGWRLVFYVNVPVGIAAIVMARYLLPRTHHKSTMEQTDWAGLVLLGATTSALLLAMSAISGLHLGSSAVIALFVLSAVLLVAFVWREHTAAEPLVPLSLLAHRDMATGLTSGMFAFVALFGMLVVAPFLLDARGIHVAIAGIILTALPRGIGIAAAAAGALSGKFSGRLLTVTGMLIAAVGLVAAGLSGSVTALLAGALLIMGLGIGVFNPSNNAGIMTSAPSSSAGLASGLLNMTRGLGTALGVAVGALTYHLGGTGASAPEHGFLIASVVLAIIAAGAALVSRFGSRHAPGSAGGSVHYVEAL
ncbi:MAG: MFS transporter [Actinomycetes bacterium]